MSTLYEYTARTELGQFVSGSVHASSKSVALRELYVRSLLVTSIHSATAISVGRALSLFSISEYARIEAIRTLSILFSCGVSARVALQTCAQQTSSSRLRESMLGIVADIEAGLSFAASLARRPRDFDRIGLAMISAGEQAGVLSETLSRYAELLERKRRLRNRITVSLTYPVILLLALIGVIAVLSISVIPAFATMFLQMRVPVPVPIKIFMMVGILLRNPVVLVLGLAVITGLGLFVRHLLSIKKFRKVFDRYLRSLPFMGRLVRQIEHERVSRTLGTMLKSGVPVRDSCLAAIGTASTAHIASSLENVCAAIDSGSDFSSAMEKSDAFDHLFLGACRVGEDSGRLDDLLLKLADHYAFEVELSLDQVSSVIEPMLVVSLGAFIGFIVISLIVPLYTMIGSIR